MRTTIIRMAFLVSALMITAWIASHNDSHAIAALCVGLAGYYAGRFDGAMER